LWKGLNCVSARQVSLEIKLCQTVLIFLTELLQQQEKTFSNNVIAIYSSVYAFDNGNRNKTTFKYFTINSYVAT